MDGRIDRVDDDGPEPIEDFDAMQFFDADDPVFKDASVFEKNFIPPRFKYREEEYKNIGYHLKYLFDGSPDNIFLHGPPGTGKTHIVTKLSKGFNQFAYENDKDVKYVLVNCRNKTYPTVIHHLCEQLNRSFPPRGIGVDQMVGEIANVLKKYSVSFIFDEIDRMIVTSGHWKPLEELVGTFSRLYETYAQVEKNYSITLIANNSTIIEDLDDSTMSTYCPANIFLNQYTGKQIADILKERCEIGFREGVIKEGLIEWFARMLVKHDHDLRYALRCLNFAGKNVKGDKRREIINDDLQIAMKEVERADISTVIGRLNDIQIGLLYSIAKLQVKNERDYCAVTSDKIWDEFLKVSQLCDIEEKAQRHIFDYVLPKMESMGLFTSGLRGMGRAKGRYKFFRIQKSYLPKFIEVLKETMRERYDAVFAENGKKMDQRKLM